MPDDVLVLSPLAVATAPSAGLIVFGIAAAVVAVAMWRMLLRLLLIALVALVVIGLGVVMSPALATGPATPSGTSQAPTTSSTSPMPSNTQRAQTG